MAKAKAEAAEAAPVIVTGKIVLENSRVRKVDVGVNGNIQTFRTNVDIELNEGQIDALKNAGFNVELAETNSSEDEASAE